MAVLPLYKKKYEVLEYVFHLATFLQLEKGTSRRHVKQRS